MKKYFLFLLCICSNFVYAQEENCGSHINCDPATEYPYVTCDGTTKCSNDPNSLSPKVVTAPFPLCLDHNLTNGPPNEVYVAGGAGTVKVFDMSEVENDIEYAQYQWACVCGKQDEPCAGCMELKWSNDNADFVNPNTTIGTANLRWYQPSCKNVCALACIVLNNTAGFIDKEGGYQKKALVNKDVYYDGSGGCRTYNLCDLLTHELGHLYGLHHIDENHCNSSNSSSEPTTGIMNSTLTPNTPLQGLSNDDKCMFARIYCNNVGVEDEESLLSNIQVKTYPSQLKIY